MDGLFYYHNSEKDKQGIPQNLIEISSLIEARTKTIKSNLSKLAYADFDDNKDILDIILYTFSSGKTYYRSFFVEILGEAFDVTKGKRRFIGTILEILHNSIIMENYFPEIDNVDYRHNKLTCHRKYSQIQTMIVSNILTAWVYQLIASYKDVNISNDKRCEIISILSKSVGKGGDYGNQMMKILLKKRGIIYKDEIIRITKQDLSSLFTAGADCIFLLSNIDDYEKQQIRLYLTNLFNLFEIYNNINNSININYDILEQAKIIKQQAIKSIDNILINAKKSKKDVNECKFQKMKDFIEYNYFNIEIEFDNIQTATNFNSIDKKCFLKKGNVSEEFINA